MDFIWKLALIALAIWLIWKIGAWVITVVLAGVIIWAGVSLIKGLLK